MLDLFHVPVTALYARIAASWPSVWTLGRSETRIQCGPNILNLNDGVTSRRPAACAGCVE